MTKKDYVAIGKALRTARYEYNRFISTDISEKTAYFSEAALQYVTAELANVFAADNPNFDRARFLRFVETGKDIATAQGGTKGGLRMCYD